MLELLELKFKNIGRFTEEQTIDFKNLGTFVQVDGQNNNSGGSSGSGKTTIFNSLDYLLGINSLPATILQSRYTKEPIWVQGKFEFNGEILTVTRNKSKFSIENNTVIEQGEKAELKLKEILGMPEDLFRKVTHKRQKEGGFFLDLTPNQMHAFLMDCVGLSDFKLKYEIVDKKLSQLETGINSLTLDKISTEAQLNTVISSIKALGDEPKQEVDENILKQLKEKYERTKNIFEETAIKLRKEENEFNTEKPSSPNMRFHSDTYKSLEDTKQKLEASIKECNANEQKRKKEIQEQIFTKIAKKNALSNKIEASEKAKIEAQKIYNEIKIIRGSHCPTCSQTWQNERSKTIEEQKSKELNRLKDIVIEGEKAKSFLPSFTTAIDELKSKLENQDNSSVNNLQEKLAEVNSQLKIEKDTIEKNILVQNKEYQTKLNAFLKKAEELRKRHELQLSTISGQLDLERRSYELMLQKYSAYLDAKKRYSSTFDTLSKNEAAFTKKINELNTNLNNFLEEQKIILEIKKAIKLYISCSFDDALITIGDKASKIISCIPNIKNAIVQFSAQKETKDGRIKEEVTATLSSDGETNIPIKSLSGGERSAVDLAVDLAVIDFIETKTGKGSNFFITDEPFDGLGPVEIEMILEVLKNSNINKKIIIVDHHSETKEMVQNYILVERDGLTSNIVN